MFHAILVQHFLLLGNSQFECFESQSSIWNRYSEFSFHVVLTKKEMQPKQLRPNCTQTRKANRSTGCQACLSEGISPGPTKWITGNCLRIKNASSQPVPISIKHFLGRQFKTEQTKQTNKQEEKLICSLKKASISEKCLAH